MNFLGIDVGKTGAIALIRNDGMIDIQDCPVIKVGKKYETDTVAMANLVKELTQGCGNLFCVIEKVNAMPNQGVVSMFSFGTNYGLWLGILSALAIPHQLISPQRWKKEFGLSSDKEASIILAKKLYPSSAKLINLKKHDGRAEALLLADYGKRIYSKN